MRGVSPAGKAALALTALLTAPSAVAGQCVTTATTACVPSLVGRGLREAVTAIEASGLVHAIILSREAPSPAEENTVEDQRPKAGYEVRRGSPVRIWVYTLRMSARRVPRLIGLRDAEAGRTLKVEELMLQLVEGDPPPEPGQAGVIYDQSPAPGSEVQTKGIVRATRYSSPTAGGSTGLFGAGRGAVGPSGPMPGRPRDPVVISLRPAGSVRGIRDVRRGVGSAIERLRVLPDGELERPPNGWDRLDRGSTLIEVNYAGLATLRVFWSPAGQAPPTTAITYCTRTGSIERLDSSNMTDIGGGVRVPITTRRWILRSATQRVEVHALGGFGGAAAEREVELLMRHVLMEFEPLASPCG
jgi:hypothetical protein